MIMVKVACPMIITHLMGKRFSTETISLVTNKTV